MNIFIFFNTDIKTKAYIVTKNQANIRIKVLKSKLLQKFGDTRPGSKHKWGVGTGKKYIFLKFETTGIYKGVCQSTVSYITGP